MVDGVIVVADAGTTRRSELTELTELLDGTNARVIGGVLNRDGSRVVSRRARQARRRIAEGRSEPKPRAGAAADARRLGIRYRAAAPHVSPRAEAAKPAQRGDRPASAGPVTRARRSGRCPSQADQPDPRRQPASP